jgi:pyruvate,water dikinase
MVLLPLDSPAADADVAGGKGDGLSRLTRGGFPVPAGFVIPTSAYRAFVTLNGLATEVAAGASHTLRQKFETSDVPAEIADAILAAHGQISRGPVAVRSSVHAPDLPGANFAGQHDSYLNVSGDAALLTAVRACWASLWSERAIAYRAHRQIDSTRLGMAVIVQRMVAADAAGVLCTTCGAIKHVTGGDSARRTQPALHAAQAIELARLGQAIEAHLGGAQDVDWALAGARLVILQVRRGDPHATQGSTEPTRARAASAAASPI